MLVADDDDFALEQETAEWARIQAEEDALDAALRSASRSTTAPEEEEQAIALSLEPFQSLLPLVLKMVEARGVSDSAVAARMAAIRRKIAQCEFMVQQQGAAEHAEAEQKEPREEERREER